MALRPLPPFNTPIAGGDPASETWAMYFNGLDQTLRSAPAFPLPEVALANGSGVTLTASQLLACVLLRTGPAGAFSDTTPTGADIVAAIAKAEIGSNRLILIRNGGGGTMTLLAGAGVTLQGTTTIASGNARFYLVRVAAIASGAASVSIRGLITGAM